MTLAPLTAMSELESDWEFAEESKAGEMMEDVVDAKSGEQYSSCPNSVEAAKPAGAKLADWSNSGVALFWKKSFRSASWS
jgi:hypothetical protein